MRRGSGGRGQTEEADTGGSGHVCSGIDPWFTTGLLKAVFHVSISSPDPLLLQVIGVKRLECRGDANWHKLIVSDSSNHMTAIMSGDVWVFDHIEVTKFERKVHEVHNNVLAVVAFTSISSHHSDVIGSATPCNHPLDATEPYDPDESVDESNTLRPSNVQSMHVESMQMKQDTWPRFE